MDDDEDLGAFTTEGKAVDPPSNDVLIEISDTDDTDTADEPECLLLLAMLESSAPQLESGLGLAKGSDKELFLATKRCA